MCLELTVDDNSCIVAEMDYISFAMMYKYGGAKYGGRNVPVSMMKASESFVEFMSKTDRYEFDCGKGIFFEEHIFSERWFEQGGVPDGLKMWVPILKK